MSPGETRLQILRLLLQGPMSASEVADAVGVSKTGARRHLEGLLDEGATAAFSRQEGTGRPAKVYEITDEGRERFPRRYAELLERLARAADRGDAAFGDLMEGVAEELADEYADGIPEGPVEDRVRAAAEALRDLGFPVEVEDRGDRLVIVRRDCAFYRLAKARPGAVCDRLDTGLLRRLLGPDVELEGCLPRGRDACRHVVPRPDADEGD